MKRRDEKYRAARGAAFTTPLGPRLPARALDRRASGPDHAGDDRGHARSLRGPRDAGQLHRARLRLPEEHALSRRRRAALADRAPVGRGPELRGEHRVPLRFRQVARELPGHGRGDGRPPGDQDQREVHLRDGGRALPLRGRRRPGALGATGTASRWSSRSPGRSAPTRPRAGWRARSSRTPWRRRGRRPRSSARRPPAGPPSRRWRPAPTTCSSSSTTSCSSSPRAGGPRRRLWATTRRPATPSGRGSTPSAPRRGSSTRRASPPTSCSSPSTTGLVPGGSVRRRAAAPGAGSPPTTNSSTRDFQMKTLSTTTSSSAAPRGSFTTATPRASRSTTTTATFRRSRSPATTVRGPLPRSGSGATTTSGGRCAPTASPSASARGTRPPREKFDAWVSTLPHALGNPLYHWSHLELARLLRDRPTIANAASARRHLDQGEREAAVLRVHDILAANHVAVVCTTDDPADPLDTHERIRSLRPEDARLPGLPARQGARRREPDGIQPLGRAAGRCGADARELVRRLSSAPLRPATTPSTSSGRAFRTMGWRRRSRSPARTPRLPGHLRGRARRGGPRARRTRRDSGPTSCSSSGDGTLGADGRSSCTWGRSETTTRGSSQGWARTRDSTAIGDFEQTRALSALLKRPRLDGGAPAHGALQP